MDFLFKRLVVLALEHSLRTLLNEISDERKSI